MILLFFLLATLFFFLQMIPSLTLPIHAYIPWIVYFVLREKGKRTYLYVAFVGFFIDLLANFPFGLYPISYVATAFFLSHYRKRFSSANPLHFTLCTTIGSWVLSLSQLLLLFILSEEKLFWGALTLVDLLGRGFLDGLYAFLLFSPFQVMGAKILHTRFGKILSAKQS